jgi:RNA polymerase sigma-70 factor (ECF subfamily)
VFFIREGEVMASSERGDVTQLLIALRAGDRSAENQLISIVYRELKHLAAFYLGKERPDHTLQPTALVHEAYIRLTKLQDVDWESRAHFFAMAAKTMRRILVDHARAQSANKREALHNAVSLDEVLIASVGRATEVIALDDALERLAQLDPRQSKVVELRFFGGLSEAEIGRALSVSERTVKRDWRLAKAWLYKELRS